jgi:murein DD-endopeptidase MepM/ murein hydrolase activator NlpD
MIVHADGYVTAYQYMNKIVVKPGDIVRRGQLIGNSGGEPGTR